MSDWFRSYGFADVLDDLLVGAYPLDAADVAVLEGLGVQRILNLVEDEEYEAGQRAVVAQALAEAGIEEDAPEHGRLRPPPARRAGGAVQKVVGWLKDGQRVYVHCRAGWQRSPAVAAGVVAVYEGSTSRPRWPTCGPASRPPIRWSTSTRIW